MQQLKFAALEYCDAAVFQSRNLGDEIQTLAALRLLPPVNDFINREGLNAPAWDDQRKLLLNGWFMHRPESWPPSDRIVPLLISMHITQFAPELDADNLSKINPQERILSGPGLEYLKRWMPVGARDTATLRMLQESGVDSYFSGCLTLTFDERGQHEAGEKIYCVDSHGAVCDHIARVTGCPVKKATHFSNELNSIQRFDTALRLLDDYRHAKGVVTPQLHAALPCLAMGVPVLFIDNAVDRYRFDGLRELLNCTTLEGILRGEQDEWIRNCPSNKNAHLSLRRALIDRVAEFVATSGTATR